MTQQNNAPLKGSNGLVSFSLFVVMLIIMLPVVFSQELTGLGRIDLQPANPAPTNATNATLQNSSGSNLLNVTFPSRVNDHKVDLDIQTSPSAKLSIFVNGDL